MKITVISSTVFSVGAGGLQGYGGLEQIAYLTAKGLAGKGHEVTLIAPDESTCPGCRVFHTGPAGQVDEYRAFSGYNFRYKDEKGEEKEGRHPDFWSLLMDQDVVIDNSWQKWAYTLKEEGSLKAPVLGVLHAPVNTMYSALPRVEKPCFVCISEDQADHFYALHGRRAKVCHNGVDTEFYKPLDVPRTDRFLFLARFSTIKGPDLAISACRKAGVGLDLIGDTSITQEPEYFEHCKSMCDGEQIRMVGGVSRGETVWWYSRAKAFLHPNLRFREPFGLAPLEAQLCGLPVIAFDNGAMRETVPHGEKAFMDDCVGGAVVKTVEEFDRMVGQLSGVKIHQDIRNNIWRAAMRFSVENMVNCYESLCLEALKTGGW